MPRVAQAFTGRTPLDFPASDPGHYIAILLADGHEPRRLSFHLDHACEHYAKGLVLETRLTPTGQSPAGFVFVEIGPLDVDMQPFWIQEREVTSSEYLQFLNTQDAQTASDEGQLGLPHCPGPDGLPSEWVRDQHGRVRLPTGMSGHWPLLGVNSFEAQAYVAWFGQRPELQAAGLRAALPTLGEWRWAVHGGDSRRYVHGNNFATPWVKGRFTRDEPCPEDVRSFPLDESPWGVYDLAGSAAEWVFQRPNAGREGAWALAGGGWSLGSPTDFAGGSIRYVSAAERDPNAGIRMVLRPKPR